MIGLNFFLIFYFFLSLFFFTTEPAKHHGYTGNEQSGLWGEGQGSCLLWRHVPKPEDSGVLGISLWNVLFGRRQ